MTFCNNFVASVKANGKILREIDSRVILPFQSEYSILLKNLNGRKASVTISIDGQDVLYGKSLIINPNESIELERFIDNISQGNKFKFIKKTQEISDYRGGKLDDGLIRVAYRFEKHRQEFPIVTYPLIPYPYQLYWPFYYPWTTWTADGSSGGAVGGITSGTTDGAMNCTSTYSNLNCNQVSFTSDGAIGVIGNVMNCSAIVEDGITVQGSKSEQQFSYGTIGELEENSHVIIIGLKGSDKITTPITVKTKFQCPTCGKVSKDKFCGNCGTNLELY